MEIVFKSEITELTADLKIGGEVIPEVKLKEFTNEQFNNGELTAVEVLELIIRENDEETKEKVINAFYKKLKPSDSWAFVNILLGYLEGKLKPRD